MQPSSFLIVVYSLIFLILAASIGAFIYIVRNSLLRKKRKTLVLNRPSPDGLGASSIFASIQSQVLELQATEPDAPEHAILFGHLLQFIKDAKPSLRAESGMLDLHILRLESVPPTDPGQLPTLAALFSWSQTREKELLRRKP